MLFDVWQSLVSACIMKKLGGKKTPKTAEKKEYYLKISKLNPAASHLVRLVTPDTASAAVNTPWRVSEVTSTRAALELSIKMFTQQKTQIL